MADVMKITFQDASGHLEITKVGANSYVFNAVRSDQNVNLTLTKLEMEAVAAVVAASVE